MLSRERCDLCDDMLAMSFLSWPPSFHSKYCPGSSVVSASPGGSLQRSQICQLQVHASRCHSIIKSFTVALTKVPASKLPFLAGLLEFPSWGFLNHVSCDLCKQTYMFGTTGLLSHQPFNTTMHWQP